MALEVIGSNPISHPTFFYHYIGVSPSGKARDFDSLMRWFESSYPSLIYAGVAELADAQDLKSCCGDTVPVRFRSPALHYDL